jgi:repressor LexA
MDDSKREKLHSFYRRERRMPTYAEMAKLWGYKSKNAVARLVEKFVDAGLVAKDHLGRLVPTKALGEVPMLGSVKAGIPSATEEQVLDTVSLDELLLSKPESAYILKVDGDSMIDAHIAPGDLVVAEKKTHAKDGEIVIAEVDGEWTMKYYRERGTKVWLEAANEKYDDIYPTESLRVAAVVRGVIRKYP